MSKRMNFEARRGARRITEQAASWYLEQQEHPTERQQAAFLKWLRTSPAHVAEYLAIAQMHGDLKAAASIETLSTRELAIKAKDESALVAFPHGGQARASQGEHARTASRMPGALRLAAVAAAALLMLLGGAYWRVARAQFEQRYTAGTDAIREVTLPDESLVRLAKNSRIDVHFNAHERRIEVLDGHAMFDIGKDAQRPMLVVVGGHVLQDIGTVFDVQHQASGDTLTVLSGHVRVWNAPERWRWDERDLHAASQAGGHALADVTAGQQIQLHASGVSAVQPAIIAQATAWLPSDIRFQHETVADVARRFNAYTTTPLLIEDKHVAQMRISGVFHANHPEAFVAYLAGLPGVRVVQGGDHVGVLAVAGNEHAGWRGL